jgi:PBP1b-binding outer membrane lipoprotein LpoB
MFDFKFYICIKPLSKMKKITIILAAVVLSAVVFSSCQGGKKCPAYSQVKTEKVKHNS